MGHKTFVLAVGRNPRNLELLAQALDAAGYETVTASSLDELDHVLDCLAQREISCEEPDEIRLALVDVAGFNHDIWVRFERFRKRGVVVLVLLPARNAAAVQQSLSHGANAVLPKPSSVRELLAQIHSLLTNRSGASDDDA